MWVQNVRTQNVLSNDKIVKKIPSVLQTHNQNIRDKRIHVAVLCSNRCGE